MGRRHLIQCSVGQGRKEDRHKMILPVVSSLLLASLALCAPGANYGAAAHVSPAKQISSPSIQCRTEYVVRIDMKIPPPPKKKKIIWHEKSQSKEVLIKTFF